MCIVGGLEGLVSGSIHPFSLLCRDYPLFVELVVLGMGWYAVSQLSVEKQLGRTEPQLWKGGVSILEYSPGCIIGV